MDCDALIDGILTREGGYVDNPADRGGATKWGITAPTWGLYKRLGRQATRAEVQAITRDQAATFYRLRYVQTSPFTCIADEPLRAQLIDFGINSGTERATRWLQRVLRVPVTGIIDDRTKAALASQPAFLVNEALIAARVRMDVGIVRDDPTQAQFLHGWVARAVSFSEVAE